MSTTSKSRRRTSHEFSTRAPDAKSVCVAGTFNGWNAESIPMRMNEYGVWSVELRLAPGRYEYRYVVDGEWRGEEACEESHRNCPHCVPNPFGTTNCVLEVH